MEGRLTSFRLYLVVNRGWYVLRPTRSSRPATDRAEDWTPAQLAILAMQVEVVSAQSQPGEQSKKVETIKMSLMLQLEVCTAIESEGREKLELPGRLPGRSNGRSNSLRPSVSVQ